jgi:XTP/dITP diphosphohydrolase
VASHTTIVFASGNAGKLREVTRLLAHLDVIVAPQSDYDVTGAEETGSSFAANAIIKAEHASRATGLPAIADDSGLLVNVLDGRPGVYSARYAGATATDDENIDKLLGELEAEEHRAAAFHCAACFVSPDLSEPLLTEGTWYGEILRSRRGTGGFGYDPVFLDPASGLAAAELTAAEKNERSHRAQALHALSGKLSLLLL